MIFHVAYRQGADPRRSRRVAGLKEGRTAIVEPYPRDPQWRNGVDIARHFEGLGIRISNAFFRQAEEYGWTCGLSMTRAVGPGWGTFRAVASSARQAGNVRVPGFHRPEAPGSGGVLASRASAGQRRLSAQGLEPGGRGSRPGIRPFGVGRMSARAIGVVPGRASRDGGSWRSRGDVRCLS